MAKTFTPPFAQNQVLAMAAIGTANTNRDGTGTIVTVYTAPAEGARISYIRVKAIVTTTAGMVRIYVATTSGGTPQLIAEIPVSAITPSGTVQAFEGEFYFTEPLLLLSGYTIFASTHNAEAMKVFAMGSSF